MTIHRASILQSMASVLAAAMLIVPGAAPPAHAAGQLNMRAVPEYQLVFSHDRKGNAVSHFVPKGYRKVKSSAAADATALKAAPDYGSLTLVPGTVDDGSCAGSSGIALDPSGRFAYASGGFGLPGRLCGFKFDPVTQVLTPVTPTGASPAATGTSPGAVAVEPSGRFLYVAGNGTGGNVSGYAIDEATGVPTPLPGSPFLTTGELPRPVVIDRAGRFMYVGQSVGSFDGSIDVFAIDATTGALTPVPGSPFPNVANGGRIAALALSQDGRFLFAGGSGLGTYSVNATTGVPTRIAYRAGNYFGLTVEPTGRFLYAPEFFASVLHGFSIAANGTLTPVGTPQAIGSVSRGIVSIADLVYVASSGTDQAYGFRINPTTGALTPVAGSPFATLSQPNAIAGSADLPPSIEVDAGDNVVASVGVYGGRPPYTWSVVSGALPPGSALNATTGIFSGVLSVAGTYSFTAQVADSLGATVSTTKSITVLGSGVAVPVSVIEFYNASLDHYFITYVADEIAKLDNGTFKGWARTGLSFNAFATTQSGTSAVCRIYIPPGKGDGHFFGRDANECDGTMAKNPTFILESSTFLYLYPPTLGNCAAGQIPVYRVFSDRTDANHRYTTSRTVRDQMVAKGWLAEGDGADTVVMCAPA